METEEGREKGEVGGESFIEQRGNQGAREATNQTPRKCPRQGR